MATSCCIFLCCRGDRLLFLPREREVEVSSLGSRLKRKDMAKRRARSETERGRRGGLYPEAVAGARMQKRGFEKNVDISQCECFSRARGVAKSSSHHSITALAARRSRYCPARIVQRDHSGRLGTIGGAGKKIRDSRFAIQALRSPLRGRCGRGRAASHRQGAIAPSPLALLDLAGLAGTSCLSPKGPSFAVLVPREPGNDSATGRPDCRNKPPAQVCRGRTGVPAPESGEQTLSESTVPNHDRGINTVKRVSSASGRALHRPCRGAPTDSRTYRRPRQGCR